MGKPAVVFGATGLTGRHPVRLLLGDPAYHRVVIVARRYSNVKLRDFLLLKRHK